MPGSCPQLLVSINSLLSKLFPLGGGMDVPVMARQQPLLFRPFMGLIYMWTDLKCTLYTVYSHGIVYARGSQRDVAYLG
jgi:hypothetical protein